MKWVFVVAGAAMVIIGGVGKYVDITKFKEPFISNNSPYYTIFVTGVITIILGLSFDWIMSLDDEEEEAGKDKDKDEGEEKGESESAEAPPEAGAESVPGESESAPKDEPANAPEAAARDGAAASDDASDAGEAAPGESGEGDDK